jgi:Transposase, Mutator family
MQYSFSFENVEETYPHNGVTFGWKTWSCARGGGLACPLPAATSRYLPGDGSGHEGGKDDSASLIDEIVREGARRMLAEALQAEVDAYIAAHAAERDENGRRLVVRNGCHQPREDPASAVAIEVRVPRVNDKRTDPDTGERKRRAFTARDLSPCGLRLPVGRRDPRHRWPFGVVLAAHDGQVFPRHARNGRVTRT